VSCASNGWVEAQCDALVRREQFVRAQGMEEWPDGTVSARYSFLHDLYHEVIYDRVPASRRLRWHTQIGDQLEVGYGDRSWEVAAKLAMHFTQGRNHARAVHYHKLAAQEALGRWAYQEAMRHLREGLAGIEVLSETPERTQQELDYQIALGQVLTATKGHGDLEVERTYARARTLCQQVRDPLSVFKVLQGQQLSSLLRGEMQTARELAEQLLILARRQPDPVCPLVAHAVLGMTLNYLGEFIAARMHLEQGITLSDPEQQRATLYRYGVIHGVLCRAYASQTLWYLGYPAQARRVAGQTCRLAQDLASPHSLAYAHYHTARLLQLLGEVTEARAHAEIFTALAQEQQFTQFLAQGTFLKGWMLAAQGQGEVGLAQMHQGLTAALATGAELVRPFYLALLAEGHGTVGQTDEGLRLLDEALAAVKKGGQHYCEAEIHRLKGELLRQLSSDNTIEAESSFHKALDIAGQQHAKSWELRAATSLAGLWQSQGKRQAAYDLLAPVHGWFTEGFDTVDLKKSQALLDELG
jgi:predicted ATPase